MSFNRVQSISSADFVRNCSKIKSGNESGYTKLSKQELIDLVIQAKTCPKAMEKVLFAVFPYIRQITGRLHIPSNTNSMDNDDVFQSSIFGLIRAVEKYDPNVLNDQGQSMSFTTYATHWIKQTAGRSIDNGAQLIRLPCHITKMYRSVSKRYKEWCMDNDEIPQKFEALDPKFLGQFLSDTETLSSITYMQDWLIKGNVFDSLDEIYDFGENGIGDSKIDSITSEDITLNPEVGVSAFLENEETLNQIRKLPQRKRLVIYLRFGIGPFDDYTLQEVGDIIGLTRERVRQIEEISLRMLRGWFKRNDEFAGKMISSSRSGRADIVSSDILMKFTPEQIKFLLSEDELENLRKTVDFPI